MQWICPSRRGGIEDVYVVVTSQENNTNATFPMKGRLERDMNNGDSL